MSSRMSRHSLFRWALIFPLTFLVVSLAHRAGASRQEVSKESEAKTGNYQPADGPYSVGVIADSILHDTPRSKDLHIKITYPRGEGPFPVIVFSHGWGGSKDTYAHLTSFWVARGYVTIQPTHDDSLALRRQQGRGIGLGSLREDVENVDEWRNRVRDITLILDSLALLGAREPELNGKIDARHVGIGGHSYGAGTTMMVGGATVDISDEAKRQSLADPRPAAFLVISGEGNGAFGFSQHSWDHFTRPLMNMTGSQDLGLAGQAVSWRMESYKDSPPGDKYSVLIEGADHMTFTGLPAATGKQPENLFEYAEIAGLAFWDAYLKESASAKAYLASDALASYSHRAVKLERK